MISVAFLLPSLSGGGAERVASLLSREIDSRPGFRCHLVVFDSTDIRYPVGNRFVDLGIPKSRGLREWWNVFLRARRLRQWRSQVKIDITISFLFGADLANILAGGPGKRVVSIRIFYFDKRRTLSQLTVDTVRRWLYRKSDCVVAVSEELANEFRNRHLVSNGKLNSIPNPYDLDMIEQLAAKPLPGEWSDFYAGKTVLVTMGRLSYQKGQQHLIRAFRLFIEGTGSDAVLVILGEGPDHQYLKNLVRDCGLSGRVKLAGFQPNPFPFLSNAHLFVFTSLYEGFCNVVPEAMSCGLPVISSDCRSGPREILDGRSGGAPVTQVYFGRWGVLVPVCDGVRYSAADELTDSEKAISEAISRFMNEPSIRDRYSGLSKVRCRDFHIDTITDRWITLIRQLLEDVNHA